MSECTFEVTVQKAIETAKSICLLNLDPTFKRRVPRQGNDSSLLLNQSIEKQSGLTRYIDSRQYSDAVKVAKEINQHPLCMTFKSGVQPTHNMIVNLSSLKDVCVDNLVPSVTRITERLGLQKI
jgi:hypothetical protein